MSGPRSEQGLLDATVELALHCKWAVHHDRPARRTGSGWHTAIQGHAGFPDLVLGRRGVVLFRELKGYDKNGRMGRLSSEQRDWAKQIGIRPSGNAVLVELTPQQLVPLFGTWTPDDWDLIVATLTAKSQQLAAS